MNNVKKYRKGLGLTLEELANRAGTTKSYVWEIESDNRCSPSIRKAYAISRALNKSVYDVFPDDQEYTEEVVQIKVVKLKK
jgi:transcriptional regulator with XRE-family HTH domain